MVAPRYSPVLVQRSPAPLKAPTLDKIDEIIIHEKLSWSTELGGDGGFITFAAVPDQQSQDIKNVLIDIAETACEIWLYRDDVLVQAGPVIGVQTQGPTIVVIARALAYYLRYMFISPSLSYEDIDQYTIGKGIIDQWQNKTFGHFGIETSSIGTSGSTRSIEYSKYESPNVFRKLEQLSDNVSGFEWYVDPNTRAMIFTDRRGSDKSNDVILDSRAVLSPSTHFSVAQGDYANNIYAVGSSVEEGDPKIGLKTNQTAIEKFGRVGAAATVDEADTQQTVDDTAQSMLDTLDHVHFIPSTGTAMPVAGAGVMDFDVGDTIHWVYDYGLGLFRVDRDVFSRVVNVRKAGEETMTVELL
jgi:hypothetical protein